MSILKMSLLASILIIMISIIRYTAINKLPKKTFMILWCIVMLRLLVPFSFSLDISSSHVIDSLSEIVQESPITDPITVSAVERQKVQLPLQSEKIIQTGWLGSIPPYLTIWFIGMVLMIGFFLVTHLRNLSKYKTALPVQHQLIEKWIQQQRRKVDVRQSDKIISPLTYGIWRPVILLPKTMDLSDASSLKYVLTHEYIHIQRFDTLAKWLLAATLSIHWFNPFVWLMYIFANRDIELSCDEAVVNTFGDKEKSSYARTLINMAEIRSGWVPLHSNFSKNVIEERIVAIMKQKQTKMISVIMVVGLVAGATFLTSAQAAEHKANLLDSIHKVEDINKYFEEMNGPAEANIIDLSEEQTFSGQKLSVYEAVFTNHQVYAIIGLENVPEGHPVIKGRIETTDHQRLYELEEDFKEIEREGDVRYFFYAAEIVNADASKDDTFNLNSISHHREEQIEPVLNLSVFLQGDQYKLLTPIEHISEEMLFLHPEELSDTEHHIETLVMTRQGIKLSGMSKQQAKICREPRFEMKIVHKDGSEINFSYDTRGSISDEGFPMSLSLGADPETCEFSGYWYLRQWEIDLEKVERMIIDGVSYLLN